MLNYSLLYLRSPGFNFILSINTHKSCVLDRLFCYFPLSVLIKNLCSVQPVAVKLIQHEVKFFFGSVKDLFPKLKKYIIMSEEWEEHMFRLSTVILVNLVIQFIKGDIRLRKGCVCSDMTLSAIHDLKIQSKVCL